MGVRHWATIPVLLAAVVVAGYLSRDRASGPVPVILRPIQKQVIPAQQPTREPPTPYDVSPFQVNGFYSGERQTKPVVLR